MFPRKFSVIVFVLILIPGWVLTAPTDPVKRPGETLPVLSGDEVVSALVTLLPYPPLRSEGTDDILGDTITIGTSWNDIQHNGTCGRMLEKDEFGYIHFVWMNGLNEQAIDRHVYYNYIDTLGNQGWPGVGYPVESSIKAGFANMDVHFGGIAFPAFHEQVVTGGRYHAAVAHDFLPHSGAFIPVEPDWIWEGGQDLKIDWARIAIDRQDQIHVMAMHNPVPPAANGTPKRQYYTLGTYDPITYTLTFPPSPDTWTLVQWSQTIAYDLVASDVSDRVAFAWTFCKEPDYPGPDPLNTTFTQWNNDIYVLIDDDGLDFHFDDAFNLTQFIPPDLQQPDTLHMNMDTLRAYTDLNPFIDLNNWVHVVFTTPAYYELEGLVSINYSIVWHWSEEFPGEFQMIHNGWGDFGWVDCGAWNLRAQRPMLGQDPATGYLYCMYQVYDVDTTALSTAGWPSGEIYISVSTDGGATWAVGTNVTNTTTRPGASPGQCLSELTPSMAKVVDDTCHILYVLDLDAGAVTQNEGTWTLNPIKYHRVPVDLIPTTPLVPDTIPFHVEHGTWPGIPSAGRYEQPKTFGLEQNYPNPFNPATSIRFSLDEVSGVSLQVFNLKGEMVSTLASGTYGTGQHTVVFDGSGLASGVYIYKLEAGRRTLVRKMLLLK